MKLDSVREYNTGWMLIIICWVLCFCCIQLCVFMFWCKWKEDSGGVSRQQKAISRPTYHTLAYLATTEYHYNICSSKLNICAISRSTYHTPACLATSEYPYNICSLNQNIGTISRATYHTLAYLATTEYHYNICLLFMIQYFYMIQNL